MWFRNKSTQKVKKGKEQRLMEKDIIDMKPTWDGNSLRLRIKGPDILCSFDVDQGSKSLYFTLESVLFLKRYHQSINFPANKLLIPIIRFSGIPMDECIVSFLRQGQCMSRIAAKQLTTYYNITNSEFFPFGKDQLDWGWVIRLSNHDDWWSKTPSPTISHELE